MMTSPVLRTVSALILVASASLLAGCGEAEVSKADVEQGAAKALTESVGKKAPPITCPSGLKAKVGAKIVCTMTDAGKTLYVHVTANAVDGSNVKYGVEVTEKPE